MTIETTLPPRAGFNPKVIEELNELCEPLFDVERYVVLLCDEMKIRVDLVFNKRTGEIIGFTDLGDPFLNYGRLEEDSLATHALEFLLRGLSTDFKFVVGFFGTTNVTSTQIMALFWDEVLSWKKLVTYGLYLLLQMEPHQIVVFVDFMQVCKEKILHLQMLFTVPSMYMLHTGTYYIFFANGPHLIKTARNCVNHSGFGSKHTRNMWNNGFYIIWEHFCKV